MSGLLAKGYAPPLLAMVLLAGVMVDKALNREHADPDPFREKEFRLFSAAPPGIGAWGGIDLPPPPSALPLLRPNVLCHRLYLDPRGDLQVRYLVVHGREPRDLVGTDPAVCYPAQGWVQTSSVAVDWRVPGLSASVRGTEYEFVLPDPAWSSRQVVECFLVLPGGPTLRSLDELDELPRDQARRFPGAAQVQVALDAAIPAAEREEIVRAVLAGSARALAAVLSGGRG